MVSGFCHFTKLWLTYLVTLVPPGQFAAKQPLTNTGSLVAVLTIVFPALRNVTESRQVGYKLVQLKTAVLYVVRQWMRVCTEGMSWYLWWISFQLLSLLAWNIQTRPLPRAAATSDSLYRWKLAVWILINRQRAVQCERLFSFQKMFHCVFVSACKYLVSRKSKIIHITS